MSTADVSIWAIAASATAGVILQPFKVPEAVWAGAGALALVCFGLLPIGQAWQGIEKGLDVYQFLLGMMLLAEVARETGLFDWLASLAAANARGSPIRLFRLIYVVGIAVTVFLSNDATAVVLTPAVAAVARAAKVAQPLPYLLICAFIANAASFVLPISNPANLVIYGSQMPPLALWLPRFALPSVVAIVATYVVLRVTQRKALAATTVAREIQVPRLSGAGKAAAWGIVATALLLMIASAEGWQLGMPTFIAGVLTVAGVLALQRAAPFALGGYKEGCATPSLSTILRQISWGVLPLVAGLFVLVEGLGRSGAIAALSRLLQAEAQHSIALTALLSGLALGFGSNLVNNLPAGLLAGTAVQAAGVSPDITSAILIGVDLGPNLSVTGSLATILWLAALRREGVRVDSLKFLALGALLMPPALLLSLATLLATIVAG